MAEFDPEIQGPASAWMIGRGAEAPKSVVGELGDIGATAITKGIDIFRSEKANSLQGAEGEELSSSVRDYAKNADTALVGSNPSPAANDPGYQAATSEIDRHASAAAQGSPGAKQAFLTRVSEITSRYAAQNPYYAPQLQEYAQKVLGFNANAALFNVASDAEDFQRSQTRSSIEGFRKAADDAGATVFDANGNVDLKSTVLNGQRIALASSAAKLELERANLAAAQAKPTLSQDQIADTEFRTAQPAAQQVAEAASGGVFTRLTGIIDAWNKGAPMDQAQIGSAIGQAKTQALAAVDQMSDNLHLGFTSRGQLKTYVENKFSIFTPMMGSDLTNTTQYANALKRLHDNNVGLFHQLAPHAAAAYDIGGPTVVAPMLEHLTGPASGNGNYETLTGEFGGYFNGRPSSGDVAKAANGVMAGTYSAASEPDRQKAKAVLKTTLAVADTLSADPTRMDPKGQKAFGNIVRTASDAAVQSGDHDSILNASGKLAQPAYVQGVIAFAKNPANANAVPATLGSYGAYLRRTQKEASDDFAKGTDTTIPATVPYGNVQRQTVYRVHVSGTVDTNGRAVPVFTAKDPDGRVVTLNGDQRRQALQSDPALRRSLNAFTAASNAEQAVSSALPEHVPPPAQAPKTSVATTRITAKIDHALTKTESNDNPDAVSPVGARSAHQVVDKTNLDPGFGVKPAALGEDGKPLPGETDRVGHDYMNAMIKRYGDLTKALVAYNWGPGHADKWTGSLNDLPAETQAYISRFYRNFGGQ